ncbi:MAG: UvrB/UvrC motif-containing protein [Clostridia bacterium]|nr:UvrB/UvrC motif-containing protein [Clostridia bacterium]
MLCDNCKKRQATYHLMRSVNGKKTESHLCSECASELESSTSGLEHELQSGFSGFFEGLNHPAKRRTVCPQCGATEQEIASSGYVGCAECYNTFKDLLEPYIVRLHGRVSHCGGRPGSLPPDNKKRIADLREQLKKAISAEEFEKAAAIRDEIRGLEKDV